jgi:biopolymer transport protein ExbD
MRPISLQGANSASFTNSITGFAVTLLIVFMTLPQPHHDSPIDRPEAHNSTAQPFAVREDAIKIAIARDGAFYFRNQKVSAASVANEIRSSVEAGAERKVYLNVDARARYREVSAALDEVRYAGIQWVVVLAERPYPH